MSNNKQLNLSVQLLIVLVVVFVIGYFIGFYSGMPEEVEQIDTTKHEVKIEVLEANNDSLKLNIRDSELKEQNDEAFILYHATDSALFEVLRGLRTDRYTRSDSTKE